MIEMSIRPTLAAKMMSSRGITSEVAIPYWTKLAEAAITANITDAVILAKALCKADGNKPDQQSVGLGHIIHKGQSYALWEAWLPLAVVCVLVFTRDGTLYPDVQEYDLVALWPN